MKKVWVIISILFFVTFLSNLTIISAQEAGNSSGFFSKINVSEIWQESKQNFNEFTNNTKTAWKTNVGRFVGTKSSEGSILIFSWNEFWLPNLIMFALITFLMFIFFPLTDSPSRDRNEFLSNWRAYIGLVYVILMMIPGVNRILQLVTLELIGLNTILRSILIAIVASFAPPFYNKYKEYKDGKRAYEKKLRKVAGEEIAKAMASA